MAAPAICGDMHVRLALLQHKGGNLHHAGAMKTARTPRRAAAKGVQRASKERKVATSVLAIKLPRRKLFVSNVSSII